MSTNRALRIGCQLLFVVCLIAFAAMLLASRGFEKETPAYAGGVRILSSVTAETGGQAQEVSLPHNFKKLPARTPVTLSAPLTVSENDCLYLKSVYAPMRAYVNDRLVYECGQEGSYPDFMDDPATTVAVVPLTGVRGAVTLHLEYLSPVSRSILTIHPALVGQEAALTRQLLTTMAFPFIFSLLEIFSGVLLILIALCVVIFERRGVMLLWLGLFALSAGFWAFGECNFTGLFFSNPTALYLLEFTGLFLLPTPLIHFCLSMIDFRNPKPLRLLSLVNLGAAAAALVLQMSGAVALSRSMYAFHVLLPLTLLLLAAAVFYEGLRYASRPAKRFFLPMAVLSFSSLLEVANYQLRFVNMLSVLFQFGIALFVLIMGIIGGLFIRDAILTRQDKQQLEFEVKLMDQDIRDQKKRQALLLENAAAVRAQRHDLRHQLAVIRSFSQAASNQKLSDYLDTLDAQLPEEPEGAYCENAAVNAIVSHYAALAKAKGIELTVKLAVPAVLEQITDSNLCVIFGNLMENAIEACGRMSEGRPFIRLASRLQYGTLTIVMDNSFDGTVNRDGGGLLSSKRAEHGVGTASITAVAERNGGGAQFEADGRVFLSSVYVRI